MKTIVMTGATNGVGLAAADSMRRVPDVRLLFGARGKSTAGADALPLDLARLASVRAFAAAVEVSLGESSIDGLVLNAGAQFPDVAGRTEDGFEPTFAINHLAHYLLLRLLMPRLASGAVVVITTSDTHDPKVIGFFPPEHADARLLAEGKVGVTAKSQASRRGMRAYATSKLCNLLTARALATSTFSQQRGLRVIAFNPGAAPGTQLARNQPRALRILAAMLLPILKPILRLNTVAGGGELLADLVLGRLVPPPGRLYASQVKRQVTWPDPSELARDDTVMAKLWRDSAALVGLPEQE
jgi:NAD(P)-dependent dehydrogenase (short-subunit alcohol dehydrogenase family)